MVFLTTVNLGSSCSDLCTNFLQNNVLVWPQTFCILWSEPTLSVGDTQSTSATTFLSALIRWQWVWQDVDQLGNQKDCIESLVIGSTWLQVEESAPLKQFLISWVKLSLIFYEGAPKGTNTYMNLAQSKINQWERLKQISVWRSLIQVSRAEHVYRHQWKEGDLVMWDNRSFACQAHLYFSFV